ncbi:hypothetical protein AB0J38_43955 [Streptomyces sp. NPDC050095]|uniref:hypothetical protein n=1 Tax=unclassified Streptomyces TaxID=2593676 RepID=UPI003443C6FD
MQPTPPRWTRWTATTSVLCGCLLLVLAGGFGPLLTYVTAHAGMTVVPSALGVPLGLPGLRAVPLGDTTWPWQLAEDFGALMLLAVAVLRMRRHVRLRPVGGRGRRLLAGWTALIAGAAAAGAWRGLVAARMVEASVPGWLGYAVAGALFGALWGAVLGWIPGAGAAFSAPRAAGTAH